MSIGTITCLPGGRFSFPRSYIPRFVISIDVPVTQVSNVFHYTDGHIPTREYYTIVKDKFWTWSSNSYTMDWVLDEVYYTDNPSPTKNPLGGQLKYSVDPLTGVPQLTFYLLGIDFHQEHAYVMPPAPSGYWLPG